MVKNEIHMADNEKSIEALLTEELAVEFERFRLSFPKKGLSRTKAARRLIRAGLDDFFRYSTQHQRFFLEEIEAHLDRVRNLRKLEKPQFETLVKSKRLIVRTRLIDDNYHRVSEYVEAYNSFSSTIETRSEAYSSLIRVAIDPDKPWPNG